MVNVLYVLNTHSHTDDDFHCNSQNMPTFNNNNQSSEIAFLQVWECVCVSSMCKCVYMQWGACHVNHSGTQTLSITAACCGNDTQLGFNISRTEWHLTQVCVWLYVCATLCVCVCVYCFMCYHLFISVSCLLWKSQRFQAITLNHYQCVCVCVSTVILTF